MDCLSQFFSQNYPKTFAWRERYREACDTAKRKLSDPPVVEGPEAAKRIFGSDFREQKLLADESDFAGVKKGADVEVWPIDDHIGRKTREIGELVNLTYQEAVIEKNIQNGETRARVHTCRAGITDWSLQTQEAEFRTTITQCNTTATRVQSITGNGIRVAGRVA